MSCFCAGYGTLSNSVQIRCFAALRTEAELFCDAPGNCQVVQRTLDRADGWLLNSLFCVIPLKEASEYVTECMQLPHAAYFQKPLSFAPDPKARPDTNFPNQASAATMEREDIRYDRQMIYYYLETLSHYADAMLYETTLNDYVYYANLPQDDEHQGLFVKLARVNDESLGNIWQVVAYQYVSLETAP